MIQINQLMQHTLMPLFVLVVLWMGVVLGFILSEWMRHLVIAKKKRHLDDYRLNTQEQIADLEKQVRDRNAIIILRDKQIADLQTEKDEAATQQLVVHTTRAMPQTRVTQVLPKEE